MASSPNTNGTAAAPPRKKQISAEVVDEKKVNDKAGISTAKKSDEAAAEVSESGGEGSKKAVWNRATNGAKEAVMGADSWPALSDKGKVPHKLAGESSKSVAEVVVPSLRGTTPANSPRKQVNSPHPNSTQSSAHPGRQKSFKRHGGSASGNIITSTQPPPSLASVSQSQSSSVPSNQNTTSSHKNLESGLKAASDSQSHGINDKPQHYNPQRKGTGPHQHGDGSYNHRYGARKDQDRPNRNWNNQGNVNGSPQPSGGLPRGVIRHIPLPNSSAMYVAPPLSPTVRPFGPPVSYPEFPFYYVPVPPESIRGMSIPYPSPAPHQMFMQYIDPELYSKVINQIDYYFRNEDLVKDIYLRNNMDEEGWVPIELIAGFKQKCFNFFYRTFQVKKLTNNIAYILEAIQTSTVVEVKDDKVRRRNDWSKWLMPASLKVPSLSTYYDPGTSSSFGSHIQKLNIDKDNADLPNTAPPSGDPEHQGH